ncbi:MAG: AMP-binding protein [Alphaproteobacteria bacterium]|nr:AMP-binding protein [Alphaproteobacteria bacterium]MBL6937131.1 AMP-binding protein [Alphaproteobacteria bacterium]MBL7096307.1 AMP-binding protein [Alphaproteobacteria bacterium]
MGGAFWAQVKGNKTAVFDRFGEHSYRKINANANRLARVLRGAGLKPGDAVALFCTNRAEFVETINATRRSGLRVTPVNWHLATDEIAYILNDCEAKALVAETRFDTIREAVRSAPGLALHLSVGGLADGFEDFESALEGVDDRDLPDPVMGSQMLYTSGTTGRPKGVHRPHGVATPPQYAGSNAQYDPSTDVQMCAGPGYHAAPLAFDIAIPQASGVPIAFMGERWDTEEVFRTIQNRRVTHAHLVPIMMQRMLAAPDELKKKYDLSSLKFLVHGAAPCPPEVKHAMIEWLGPILYEYYAGSEGGAGFGIRSDEWLKKPGSVGKRPTLLRVKIMDDEGNELPNGQAGLIYHEAQKLNPFSYYKDDKKTAGAHRGEFFTLGDIGYFDEDDYLFLTGRSAEIIISGGVNIYPQEVDNEIIKHPSVEDVCTIGVPNREWGEEVKSVIMLKAGWKPSDELKKEIIDFVRPRLAGFKVPRSIDFVAELPRSAAGKIKRGEVRKPFWEGRKVQI